MPTLVHARRYHALKFDVPRFLDTCEGDARKAVANRGVEFHEGPQAQMARVVELANGYYRKVPVLIICTSAAELAAMHSALRTSGAMPAEEVQRFSEFDEKGASLRTEWQTIIDDATKRIGGANDHRCRVTVTDRFGGRGHDFQVTDKEAIANGGMLVIATSIPDEREWIQWRGRTARQDKPGHYYVILNQRGPPFDAPTHSSLASKLRKQHDMDARIEMILDVADEGIGDRLKMFSDEQATGEKLNELCELYYKKFPRDFDTPWPSEQPLDLRLRQFLTDRQGDKPADVKAAAKLELGIELE